MEPIRFNFPPEIAVKCLDDMVEHSKTDPNASEEQRAVFDDMRTLAHFALAQLTPVKAPETTPKS